MPASSGDRFKLEKWRPVEAGAGRGRSEKHEKLVGTGGVDAGEDAGAVRCEMQRESPRQR